MELMLNMILTRGRTLRVNGEKVWIPIKYEKLSRLCFDSSCLVHETGGCLVEKSTLPNILEHG